MRIRCPAEIEVHGLSDWEYYEEFHGRAVTVIQFEVSGFPGQFEFIAKCIGFGLRATVITDSELDR